MARPEQMPLLTTYIHDNLPPDLQRCFVDAFLTSLVDKDDQFPIPGDVACEWIGFAQKGHFKRMYTTRLDEGDDYEQFLSPKGKNPAGGRPSANVRFSVDAFKQLCLFANTAKGKATRKYFLALEKLVLQYGAEQERLRSDETSSLVAAAALRVTDQTLLKVYATVSVVYFNRLVELGNGKFIMKVGEAKHGLTSRAKGWKPEYGSKGLVLACIPSRRAHDFEQFIIHHEMLLPHKYTDKINGIKTSNECFTVDEKLFERVIAMATKRQHDFAKPKAKELEEFRLSVRQDEARSEEKQRDNESELIAYKGALVNAFVDAQRLSAQDPLDKGLREGAANALAALQAICAGAAPASEPSAEPSAAASTAVPVAARTVTRGEAIQQYDPETLELVAHFSCPSVVVRQVGGSVSGVRKAAERRNVYLGYRWHRVPRDVDVTARQDIGPTVETKSIKTGLVAMLTVGRDRVVAVYANQETAAAAQGLAFAASVGLAIKKGSVSANHRWSAWDDVGDALRQRYLDHHDLPQAYAPHGKAVERLHPVTGAVEETLPSIAAACTEFNVGRMAVRDACRNGCRLAGWGWRYKALAA